MNKYLLALASIFLLSGYQGGAKCLSAEGANYKGTGLGDAAAAREAGDDERVARAYRFLNEMQPDRAIGCLAGPLVEALRMGEPAGRLRAARYLLLIGYGFRLDENDEAALTCFHLADKLNPADLLACSLMGETCLRLYDYRQAEVCFKRLEPLSAHNRIAARALAFRYAAFQETDKAEKYIRLALSMDQSDPRARYTLARLLEGQEAAAQYRLAAKFTESPYMKEMFLWYAEEALDPGKAGREHLLAAGAILPKDPLWHSKIAITWMRDGKIAEVGKQMLEAAQCPRLSTRAYAQLATYLMFNNQSDAAKKCLLYIARYRPNSAELHWTLGNLYGLRGEVAAAENEYLKAISLNPRYNQAYSSLLEMSTVKRRKDFCLSKAREWTGYCANLPDGWLYMGNLLKTNKEYTAAIAAYKRAEDEETYSFLERDFARRLQVCSIHAGLGTCYYKMGKVGDAQSEARLFNKFKPVAQGQAMRVRPGPLDFARLKEGSTEQLSALHGAVADMLYECQELSDCIAEYKKALSLEPDNIDWHKGLLKAYLDKKDWAAAAREDLVVSNYMVTQQMPQAIDDWRKKTFGGKELLH